MVVVAELILGGLFSRRQEVFCAKEVSGEQEDGNDRVFQHLFFSFFLPSTDSITAGSNGDVLAGGPRSRDRSKSLPTRTLSLRGWCGRDR